MILAVATGTINAYYLRSSGKVELTESVKITHTEWLHIAVSSSYTSKYIVQRRGRMADSQPFDNDETGWVTVGYRDDYRFPDRNYGLRFNPCPCNYAYIQLRVLSCDRGELALIEYVGGKGTEFQVEQLGEGLSIPEAPRLKIVNQKDYFITGDTIKIQVENSSDEFSDNIVLLHDGNNQYMTKPPYEKIEWIKYQYTGFYMNQETGEHSLELADGRVMQDCIILAYRRNDDNVFSEPVVISLQDKVCTVIAQPTGRVDSDSILNRRTSEKAKHTVRVFGEFEDKNYNQTPMYRVLGHLNGSDKDDYIVLAESETATNIEITIPACDDIMFSYQYFLKESGLSSNISYLSEYPISVKRVTDQEVNIVPISELEYGSIVLDPKAKYKDKILRWMIVDKNRAGYPKDTVTLMLVNSNITNFLSFKPTEQYDKSNIHQWLNSDKPANEWFTPQFDTDEAPIYSQEAGFMSNLNLIKLNAVETEISCSNEYHDTKTSAKFFLPNREELGSNVGDHHSFHMMDSDKAEFDREFISITRDIRYELSNNNYTLKVLRFHRNKKRVMFDNVLISQYEPSKPTNKVICVNIRSDTFVNSIEEPDGSHMIIGSSVPVAPEVSFPKDVGGTEINHIQCDDMLNFDFSYKINDSNNDKVLVHEMVNIAGEEPIHIRSHYPELRKSIKVSIPNYLLAQIGNGEVGGYADLDILISDGSHGYTKKSLGLLKMSGGTGSAICGKVNTGFKISEILGLVLESPETPEAITDNNKISVHISQQPFTDVGNTNPDQIDITEHYKNNTPYKFATPVDGFYYRILIPRFTYNAMKDLKLTNIDFKVK